MFRRKRKNNSDLTKNQRFSTLIKIPKSTINQIISMTQYFNSDGLKGINDSRKKVARHLHIDKFSNFIDRQVHILNNAIVKIYGEIIFNFYEEYFFYSMKKLISGIYKRGDIR